MKKILRHSKAWFTLIELLVGIFVFSVGITSIFALLQTTMKAAVSSRNEVIVANFLREQMELVKYIRDNNYQSYSAWNTFPIYDGTELKTEILWIGDYTLSHNFWSDNQNAITMNDGKFDKSPVKIQKLNFSDTTTQEEKFEQARLCKNEKNIFVSCQETNGTNPTIYAAYTRIFPMKYNENDTEIIVGETDNETRELKPSAYIVDARVIVRENNNYREYDARTIITDWKK